MCNECIEGVDYNISDLYRGGCFIHKTHKVLGVYHCLSGPARVRYDRENNLIYSNWWILGKGVLVTSQEQFENSVAYRKYMLKAFI